jgi:hypothetical protein
MHRKTPGPVKDIDVEEVYNVGVQLMPDNGSALNFCGKLPRKLLAYFLQPQRLNRVSQAFQCRICSCSDIVVSQTREFCP